MFSHISMKILQCIYSLESNFGRKSKAKEVQQGCLDNAEKNEPLCKQLR